MKDPISVTAFKDGAEAARSGNSNENSPYVQIPPLEECF